MKYNKFTIYYFIMKQIKETHYRPNKVSDY